GIRNSKADWVRSNLVYLAEDIPSETVLPLFRAELKGPKLDSRLAAARCLLRRGLPEGIPVMIAEWKQMLGKEDSDRSLVDFLLSCGNKDAIVALGDNLEHR